MKKRQRAGAVKTGRAMKDTGAPPVPPEERRTGAALRPPAFAVAVRLDDIEEGGETAGHYRLGDGDVEGLAASIARDGQIVPVILDRMPTGRYRIVDGRRRVAAMRSLGREAITADVHEQLSDADLTRLAVVGNLHRAEPNAVEWGIAAEALREGYEARGMDRPAAVRRIAEDLGRSETWVRDHLYLSRLCPAARTLVVRGLLGVAHARTLALVADPARQAELAERAARDEDGSGGMSIAWLRMFIGHGTHSLTQVPWRLEVPFAGKPACEGCPSNSATDPLLFEHDEERSERAQCLDPRCFEWKQKAAATSIEKAEARAKKLVATGVPAAAAAESVAAAFVKPGSIERRVKAAQKPKRPKGEGPRERERTPEEVAREKLDAAIWPWRRKAQGLIEAALVGVPGRVTVMMAVDALEPGTYMSPKKRDARSRAAIAMAKRLKSPTLADVAAAEKCLRPDVNARDDACLAAMASAVGVEIGAPPKLDDFLPEGEEATREGAKGAKGSEKKKALGKKSKTLKRRGGR